MIPGRAALVMPWRIIAGPECLHARDDTPHRCMDKAWSRAWPWMSLPAMAVSPAGHAPIRRSAGPPREPRTASRPGFSTPPHVPQRARHAALDHTEVIWNPFPFMGGVRVIDSPGMVIFSDFGPKPPLDDAFLANSAGGVSSVPPWVPSPMVSPGMHVNEPLWPGFERTQCYGARVRPWGDSDQENTALKQSAPHKINEYLQQR